MAYTVEDLLLLFREEVEDTVEQYFWSDEEFFRYLDEAQKEFARQTDYIKDSSTPEITQLTVTANDPWVPIDPRIIEIRRVKLGSRSLPMRIINHDELDREYTTGTYGEQLSSNWDTAKGTPRLFVADEQTDQARLVPMPAVADTLYLTVIREPLLPIEDENSDLELIKSDHQRALLLYCKSMAYSKQDADTYDQNRADRFGAQFNAFCRRVKSRQTRKQRRVGTVKYGGL